MNNEVWAVIWVAITAGALVHNVVQLWTISFFILGYLLSYREVNRAGRDINTTNNEGSEGGKTQ